MQTQRLILENETLRLCFDRENGAIVGIQAKESGWELISNERFGLSFRLLVPRKGKRNVCVWGRDQASPSVTITKDALVLRWEEVRTEEGEVLPIGVEAQVQMTSRQALFSMTIQNDSDRVVENVYYPYFGDVHPSAKTKKLQMMRWDYSSLVRHDLWPRFENNVDYFGLDYPAMLQKGNVQDPFVLLQEDDQGFYLGVCEKSYEYTAYMAELHPGYRDSLNALVPESSEISGKDVFIRFALIQFPYLQPKEMRKLLPHVLEPYKGSWQKGADIYRRWRESWMHPAELPDWAKGPHTWQQLHINSPEDELRIPFRELPKIGRDCAARGVKAIQLVGWNDGGQDQGNPSHTPDPRLGTPEELRQAIAEVQAMGVKVVLFSKFTWSDRETKRFREDLIRLAVKDPYGNYYMHPGYKYQTATQLSDINTKRLIPMCMNSEEYLQVCCEEFKKMVALGADGILFDECFHHGNSLLCFDESHGHRYGMPVHTNDQELIRRFKECLPEEKRENFFFAGESCYDWQFEQYQLSYFRSQEPQYLALQRYLLPQCLLMTAVTGFDDRNMINQCLLNRFVISYEPHNFKGRLEDYPDTMDYGQQMDALRCELRSYLWDGEFCDELGATVRLLEGDGCLRYSVFRNSQNGLPCVVAVNYSHQPMRVQVAVEEKLPVARFRPVEGQWEPYCKSAQIPAQGACVFLCE